MTVLTGVQICFSRFTMVTPVTALAGIRGIEVAITVGLWPFGAMALATIDIAVATRERPARESMVKVPLIQLGNIVARTKMLSVTFVAGLLACNSGVIALTIT